MNCATCLSTAQRRPQNTLSLKRNISDRISLQHLGWPHSTRPILAFSCCHQETAGDYVKGCGRRLAPTFAERTSINSFDDLKNRVRHAVSQFTDVTAMARPSHSCRYSKRAHTP